MNGLKNQLKKIKFLRNIYHNLKKIYMILVCKVSPKLASQIIYNRTHDKKLNLNEPILFNEKLMYLKLKNIDNNLIIKCTDKYLVREYIKEKGYSSILNDLIGVYDSFDEINWEELPNKFALKCNHGCGYNIICTDKEKLDKNIVRKKINKWMNKKYGYETAEPHYTRIKPKIICEKFIDMGNDKLPTDYKIYCFNGEAKIILVMNDRGNNIKKEFYDKDWKLMHLRKDEKHPKVLSEKPKNLKLMLKCAEDLSKPFEFVRVDFYNVNNNIIFGELTFTPAGCNADYTVEADMQLGKMLKLQNNKEEI